MKKMSCISMVLLVGVPVWAAGHQAPAPGGAETAPQQGEVQQTPGQQTPELAHRPVGEPPLIGMSAEGRGIQLDVVVADKAGNPVSGLTQQEFTVLDNGQARPIIAFHAYSGAVHAGGPPVLTFILMDGVNMNVLERGQARVATEKYLRANGGHLPGPTSVFFLAEDGIQGETLTTDGNALADKMEQIATHNRSIISSTGNWGDMERVSLSMKALGVLVQNLGKMPGRKLLIWVGPGSPLAESKNELLSPKDKNNIYGTIMGISRQLREDQITLDSVSLGMPGGFTHAYQGYVKGVKSPKDALPSDMSTKVIAEQSGGLVLGPDQDLARQIGICQEDVSAYYTITFDPARADQRGEYHQVEVQTDKPYLKVRTNTGYYTEQ